MRQLTLNAEVRRSALPVTLFAEKTSNEGRIQRFTNAGHILNRTDSFSQKRCLYDSQHRTHYHTELTITAST